MRTPSLRKAGVATSRRTYRDSEKLLARAKMSIPGGVNSTMRTFEPPLVVSRAHGAYVWDLEGRRYVDFHLAFGPIILGHCDPLVRANAFAAIDGRLP